MALTGTLAYLSSSSTPAGGREASSPTPVKRSAPCSATRNHEGSFRSKRIHHKRRNFYESDLKWLGDNGFTTVSAGQITDYVEKGTALPAKPVL